MLADINLNLAAACPCTDALFEKRKKNNDRITMGSVVKTSKTGLQRPAARYDGIGKIGGGYGFLVSMVSRVVT